VQTRLAFLPLLAALALPGTSAATPVVLIDNLAEPPTQTFNGRAVSNLNWQALGFSTSATAFRISQVSVPMANPFLNTGNYFLAVYDRSGAGGVPGAKVADVGTADAATLSTVMSNPTVLDFVGLNIGLSPAAHYYLVIGGVNLSGQFFESITWSRTDSTSGTGFPAPRTETNDAGNSWFGPFQGEPPKLRIVAHDVSSAVPELDAAAGTGALGLVGGLLALTAERRRRAH
jgi:hypothetical protein